MARERPRVSPGKCGKFGGFGVCPRLVVLWLAGCGGRASSSDGTDAGAGGGSGGGSGGTVVRSGSSGSAGSSGGSGTGDPGAFSSGSSGGSGGTGIGGSSGATGSSGVTGSSSGAGSGSSSGVADASAPVQFVPAPAGFAGFAFALNGVVQKPMACPSDNWEFVPFPAVPPLDAGYQFYGDDNCSITVPMCRGVSSVILVNTAQVPMAYIASAFWSGTGWVPGVATGDPNELVGVLAPGAQVDITSVYDGGITAVLGSSDPFSDGSKYVSDEGTIPWPAGVTGSEGAAQMNVAEIEVRTSCGKATAIW
jgi:hypothetical protein